MKEAIGVGATPELALADACAKLGKESYEVQYELLEMAERKIFGLFGGRPAKVRAYIEEEEEIVREEPVKEAAPVVEVKAETKAKAAEAAPAEAAAPAKENSGVTPVEAAVDYLQKILKGLGAENIEIAVKEKEDGAELTLTGEDASMVIGHHGETLSALTYLVGLVANHVQESYYRITINTGNYREKREQTLQRLAKRMAAKAVDTGRRQSLEPMNPYERRIIHTAVQEVEGAISWSEGVDMNRHVVIGPAEGVRPTRSRSNNTNRRSDRRPGGNNRRSDNRNGDSRRNNAPAARGQISDVVATGSRPEEVKAVPAKTESKPAAKTTYARESSSVPLYGRIDIKK